jgi:protein-histidine N-methyltransferase
MSFSFGFSGDDIEHDPNDVGSNAENTTDAGQDAPPPIPAQAHDLNELVGKTDEMLYAQSGAKV